MKKLFTLLLASVCFGLTVSAQSPDIPEPDFIGETLAINSDGSTSHLEKETVQLRTRANASAVMFGIGKAKTKIILESPKAGTRLQKTPVIKFIVKAVDNHTDPLAIINIFRFEATDKRRLAETQSVSSFGSVKSGKLDRLRFTGTKYGEKSYIITITDAPAGEYGIIVSNPNAVDEKTSIVSTFAIDE